MKKKLLVGLLSMLMVLMMMPTTVFAGEEVTTEQAFKDKWNDTTSTVITLGADIELDSMLTLGSKNMTVILNGHKLSGLSGGNVLKVIGDKTLTIDGTVDNSEVYGRLNVGDATDNNGNLVISGGKYVCQEGNTCLHVNGTCTNCSVTITNATLTSPDDNAIQFNGKGVYKLTNTEVTGKTGIYIKAGEVTLDNCTVKGNGAKDGTVIVNYNGSNPTGDAIVLDTTSDYQGNIKLILKNQTEVVSVHNSGIQEAVTDSNVSAVLLIQVDNSDVYGDESALKTGDKFNKDNADIKSGYFSSDVKDYLDENGFEIEGEDEHYIVGDTAKKVLANATKGKKFTVVVAPEGAKLDNVAEGVEVKNGTNHEIVVNGTKVATGKTIVAPKVVSPNTADGEIYMMLYVFAGFLALMGIVVMSLKRRQEVR